MLLSVDDALSRILSAVQPLGTQRVSLADAVGRVLAEPVMAQMDSPPFTASAMDGYAVRAADVNDGAVLTMIGASQAGKRFGGAMGQGECVRIFTGAPLPDGADAVVMQEQTAASGNTITFHTSIAAGVNTRPLGHDFTRGQTLVAPGTLLTPAHIGLIASGNNDHCVVSMTPEIALLATGDELVLPGTPHLNEDAIIANISALLAADLTLKRIGMTDHRIAPDDREALFKMVSSALEAEPDVLITTGGASVGDHDFVQEILIRAGVEIDFWRIAMRPGKPLMFGRKGKTLVFGLPGNPVSAYVTYKALVSPALFAMQGATPPAPLMLPLAAPLPANGPRRHFIRGTLKPLESGQTGVAPLTQFDSSHVSTLAAAHCLLVHREGENAKEIGDLVPVILL